MITYVDASVVLRLALGEADPLDTWEQLHPISSELVRAECLRTVERARFVKPELVNELAARRAAVLTVLQGFDLVAITAPILERAGDPFPTAIATLDAIHLATALAVREDRPDLVLATHDIKLAAAARSMGFTVLGV